MKILKLFLVVRLLCSLVVLTGGHAIAAPTKPLQSFPNCTILPNWEWADGDSFRIKTATGEEHTIRLYLVDCLELHLGDDRSIVRFREQRRHFGIYEVGGNDEESMKIALDLAKKARDFTDGYLKKSFTLHTRFTLVRGDPKFPRFYGFITLHDKKDLGTVLVQEGHARPSGTPSSLPDGKSLTESREMLKDLEIQALKKGHGIWEKTNWDKLPAERQILRKEKAEAKLAEKLKGLKPDFKINPNTATKEELEKLDGIGPKTADLIVKKRKTAPYKNLEDFNNKIKLNKPVLDMLTPHLEFSQ